jgi:hypothetical protein
MREGHVWVGVSAQSVGVQGGVVDALGTASDGLVGLDPERYGELTHPGDRFSFDIYTQAGRAVLRPDGPAPLGDLVPTTMIAVGESQAAMFLTTYLNAVQPLVGLYDGFFLHSRLGIAPTPDVATGDEEGIPTVQVRTDLASPTLIHETETDLTVLGYAAARQDDSRSVRTWEVAGTAHADDFLLSEVYGGAASEALTAACGGPINDGPQHRTLRAALHHLIAWVVDGTEPPTAPRIELLEADAPGYAIARDELGNALGGVRTPAVDVPIATLSGEPYPDGAGFCSLFGSTTPFDADLLTELYTDPMNYFARFESGLAEAVAAGFVLGPEAEQWRDEAAAFTW